jgi:hypothetical protein
VTQLRFLSGIASLRMVLDVVVARALLTLFGALNRSITALAAWFRLAYAAAQQQPQRAWVGD